MATLESSGPCSLSEYEAWEPHRLQADTLRSGELYMYMMKLRREVRGYRAGKHIIRVLQVSPFNGESELRIVHMAFTNDRGEPLSGTDGKLAISNGLLDYAASVNLDDSLKQSVVSSGYFRGSADLANDPFQQVFEEIKVPIAA